MLCLGNFKDVWQEDPCIDLCNTIKKAGPTLPLLSLFWSKVNWKSSESDHSWNTYILLLIMDWKHLLHCLDLSGFIEPNCILQVNNWWSNTCLKKITIQYPFQKMRKLPRTGIAIVPQVALKKLVQISHQPLNPRAVYLLNYGWVCTSCCHVSSYLKIVEPQKGWSFCSGLVTF